MTTDTLPRLPWPHDGLLGIEPDFDRLRAAGPAARVLTPAGDPGWLVTRYDEVRSLAGDPRLGQSHPDPDHAARICRSGVMSGPQGEFDSEHADHARLRRLLLPSFSGRRMRTLTDRVRQLVDELLANAVAEHDDAGGPVDLHAHLSQPLPARVIGDLLGVPVTEQGQFVGLADRVAELGGDDPAAAMGELMAYTTPLANTKRRDPGSDLVSDLVAEQRNDPGLDDAEIARLAAIVLFAGHEQTMNRIDVGTVVLLDDPEYRSMLHRDFDLLDGVVEEILRLGVPGDLGVMRYAHEDIELGDGADRMVIARGDALLLNPVAANRDPRYFSDPDTFDPRRSGPPHVGPGHGMRRCIGATLVRIELRAVFATLFERLPDLRLAVAVEQLPAHRGRITGGVSALPVTW